MAGKSLIGALRVFLGIDSAELTKGTKEAENSIKGFAENAKKSLEAFAAAFAANELVEGFLRISENMDMLGKSAQKIGIPVDELSKLAYAAKLANVPFDVLQSSIEKFNKGLSEAAATGKGSVAEAFRAMGISVRDANGQVKSTNELLIEVSKSFAKHADGANKGALAMALWGKAGAAMIPLANEGAKGIAEAGDQLERFGGVVTPEAARHAEEFNDDITRLKEGVYDFLQQAVIPLLPKLTEFADSLVAVLEKGDMAKSFGTMVKDGLETFSPMLKADIQDLQKLGIVWSVLSENFTKADGWANASKRWEDAWAKIRAVNTASIGSLTDLNKMLASIGGQQSAVGKGDKAPLPQFAPFAAGGAAKATVDHHKAVDDLIVSLKLQNEEFTKSAIAMKIDQTLHRAGKYATDQDKKDISDLIILNEQYRVAQQTQLQEATNELQRQAAAADFLKGKFESWFDSAISGTFDLKNALADLAKSLATMGFQNLLGNLFSAGSENPMQGSTGGGFLSGLGKILGFATGGTIMPGGSGGVDSQLVAFRKSPDERVDITRPGQMLTSGGGTAVHFTIDARGADTARVAQLERTLTDVVKNTYKNTIKSVSRERANSPGFA